MRHGIIFAKNRVVPRSKKVPTLESIYSWGTCSIDPCEQNCIHPRQNSGRTVDFRNESPV